MGRRMFWLIGFVVVSVCAYWGWKLTARNAYEAAEYKTLDQEGQFEIREYPELMLATTSMKVASQGEDGSFMRLFRYMLQQSFSVIIALAQHLGSESICRYP